MVEISATTLLQIGIAIALAFIVPTFIQQAQSNPSEHPVSQSKKKPKRKKKAITSSTDANAPSTSSLQSRSNPSSTPTSSLASSVENVTAIALEPVRSASKKSKSKSNSKVNPVPDVEQDFPPLKSVDLSDNASAAQTSYASAASSPFSKPMKPLAERLLPKTPKTRVDDMLDDDHKDNTHLARVMRIGTDTEDTANDDGPTTGTSEEDGWTKIPSTMKKTPKSTTPSNTASSFASKNSFAVPSSSSIEPLTKKQRQNQAKKQKEKEAKEATKAEQELRLRQHQRALEATRINEYYDKGPGKKGKSAKETSGGMRATVNDAGQLVWE